MRQRGMRRLMAVVLALALGLAVGGLSGTPQSRQTQAPFAPQQVADPGGGSGGNGG